MSEKKENISTVYADSLSKKAIGKFVFSGEIANSLNTEQVHADMVSAKESGGYVFIYKRKKAVRAICIFAVEDHEIPLNAAIVDEKQIAADAIKMKGAESRVVEESDDSEMIMKPCFVLKGFYLAEAYTAERDEYKKLFEKLIKEYMMMREGKIPAYIWGDEIVMFNQVVRNGKMVGAISSGALFGFVIGLCISIYTENYMWLLWGLLIGSLMTAGTTTVIHFGHKDDDEKKK